VNQSALTGESFPVEKAAVINNNALVNLKPVAERNDSVVMGSSVVTGYATVEIALTGSRTQFGDIAQRLSTDKSETDFEKGIKKFSYLILRVIFVLVIVVFAVNAFKQQGIMESFIFALAVAIGLTPELLPIVIALGLSHGSLRMSKKDVIVKKLSAIQNLGSTNVLCTDKTGTLTEDRIALVKHIDGFGNTSEPVLLYAYLTSLFHTGISTPLDSAIKLFKHLNVKLYKKIDEIPFDFVRRRSSIVVQCQQKHLLLTKGAPEDIFSVCTTYKKGEQVKVLDNATVKILHEQFNNLSQDGFRVLGVAYRNIQAQTGSYSKTEEHDLTFMGFVAFYDPPKDTAAKAVQELQELGIAVKIITGDNELLTKKICSDIGLSVQKIMLGKDVDALNDIQLQTVVSETTVFARINPAQKERIIINLKQANNVVAYIGDGINDAPALKAADVGISVNNAVDVAKETADVILLKKSLLVLKDGVVEGRKTFQNTMKYIMMGLSSNFGNMFSMTGLSLFLPFFPMLPSQILLNNLLYDISQFTLSTDKVDAQDIKKPLKWDMKFIRKYMVVFGPVSSLFDFLTFGVMWFWFQPSIPQFQTAWFMESLATQTLVIYVIRTRKIPFLQSSPSRLLFISTLLAVVIGWVIPYIIVGKWMQFASLSLAMLLALGGLVFIYLILVQLVKIMFYHWFLLKK